jgi:hypothetical protein
LVDFWRNSDFEFSLKVRMGTATAACRKARLESAQFFNETPRGDRLPICPFEKGARWARFLAARNNA